MVYARAKRVHESAAPLEKDNDLAPLVFDQKQCMFLTHVMACQVNQTIDVKNSDPGGHNTKIDPQKGVPINPILPANAVVPYTPTAEEAIAGAGLVQHSPLDAGLPAAAQGQVLCRDDQRRLVRDPESAGRRRSGVASLARAGRRRRAERWCCRART